METVAEKPTYKFRLLAGFHCEGDTYAKNPDGSLKKLDGELVIERKGRTWGPGHPANGPIIETDIDLHKRYDKPGNPPKFQPLTEPIDLLTSQQQIDAEIAKLQAKKAELDSRVSPLGHDATEGTLKDMSEKELREWANAEEIDLGKARTKGEMIKAILKASVPA